MGPVAFSLRDATWIAARANELRTSVRGLLDLAPDQMLIVLGFEHDRFLERAWPEGARVRILDAIRSVQPDIAVAWNYSVWHRHSSGWAHERAEQLYNLKRSLVIYRDLQAFGIPAVPHVYWSDETDLDRWLDWLDSNRAVQMVAIDLQTADAEDDWASAMAAITYLSTALAASVQVLISGVALPDRIRAIRRIWPRSSFCNFAPQFAVYFPRKPRAGLPSGWTSRIGLPHETFRMAVDAYRQLVGEERLSRSALEVGSPAFFDLRTDAHRVARTQSAVVAGSRI